MSNIRKKLRKAFTITELVIVIAVIAILAAVLIPTFTYVVNRARVSNDTALARNMTTVLRSSEALNNSKTEDMYDVLIALEDGGFKLDNLNPTADGNVFAWDSKNNQIVYLGSDGSVIYSADDYDSEGDLYIAMKDESVFDTFAGYSYYLTDDVTLSKDVLLSGGSSLDTGEYTLNTTDNHKVTVSTTEDMDIRGKIEGTLVIDSEKGTITNYSNVENVEYQKSADESYHERGYVSGTFTVASDATGKIVIENDGYITKTSGKSSSASLKVESKGYVKAKDNSETSIPVSDSTQKYTLSIGTYDEFCNFRDKVNAGVSYAGMTVELTADIDISQRAWTPIGATYRDGLTKDSPVFQGTFDGKNHTISGLTNTGFQIASIYKGSNATTPDTYLEYVFGLFGSVLNATIQNVKLTNVNIDLAVDEEERVVGDSVGALVGFIATTDTNETASVSGITVSGTVKGYDAVGGVIGRSYAGNGKYPGKLTVSNCTNNASVSAIRRVAGIVGFLSGNGTTIAAYSTQINHCTNNGTVYNFYDKTNDPDTKKDTIAAAYCCAAGITVYTNEFILTNSEGVASTGNINNGSVSAYVGDTYTTADGATRYITGKLYCSFVQKIDSVS